MTIKTPSIAVPAPGRGRGRRLGLGLAAGAILAVAAGVVLWQLQRGGDTTETASHPRAAVERAAVARSTQPAPTVYVVGTEAQATAVRAAVAEADVIRAQLGAAPRADQVTVVANSGADTFFRTMAEQDAIRAQLGLPSVAVVDLRMQPAAAASGGTAPWYLHEGDGSIWYVVGSQAQAEAVGEVLSYRNKTLLLEGTPLPDARVIVVDSALAAQQIQFAAGDERAVRAAQGAPALRVVDLRPPTTTTMEGVGSTGLTAPTGEQSVGCESGLGAGASNIGVC